MTAPAASALLQALHPSGFRDMRAFFADRRAGAVTTFGFPAAHLQGPQEFAARYHDRDIYIGVAPRVDAKSRDAEGCAALHALFVDLDFKDSNEDVCRGRLEKFQLPPSAIVASGGGLQVYWFLADVIDLQVPEQYQLARMLLLSLATELKADLKSAEPARILRLPGTLNYKYAPPRPVVLEHIDSARTYPLKDFLATLPIIQADSRTHDSEPVKHGLTREVRMRLARLWLERQAPAIENQGGDNHTYGICCSVVHGHDVSAADAFEVLQAWNARCQPPWNENALRQKIRTAQKGAEGPLGDRLRLILDASDPMACARIFVARKYFTNDLLCLWHQAAVFYAYNEDHGCYLERDEPSVRAELYKFMEAASTWVKGPKDTFTLAPLKPSKSKLENTLDALRAVCNLPTTVERPSFLSRSSQFEPLDLLACPNGLLHIPTRTFHPKTPDFYTVNGIEFPYDPYAPEPAQWHAFLHSLWADDPDSIACLQEMIGYFLTSDTKLQKIMMLVGDKRSGKGIIGRITRQLIGRRNTCSPTLSSFGQPFGKQALLNKTVAIVSDARISGRTDKAMVAEALLSISGEDPQTIARKFLTDWSGTLPTRFLILTNELPNITDVSGALASRFVILHLKESFLGREDLGLFGKLERELPGILKWALEGRDRLYRRGYLQQPASVDDLIQEFGDLGSPETAFLKDCTVRRAGATVSFKDLFAAWQAWCAANGRDKPGTAQIFGKNVRAAMPWATTKRMGGAGDQERVWEGVGLLVDGTSGGASRGDM